MDVKLTSIDDIGLSTRSSNALHRAGAHTVGDMLKYNEESLLKIRNLGAKAVEEIIKKIDEYNALASEDSNSEETSVEIFVPEDFDAWLTDSVNRQLFVDWLQEKDTRVVALELLSPRAYNRLMLSGYTKIYQIAFLSADNLMMISNMDMVSASEIEQSVARYIRSVKAEFFENLAATSNVVDSPKTISDYLKIKEYRLRIKEFALTNDITLEEMILTTRAKNRLSAGGCKNISDIVTLGHSELVKKYKTGAGTADEILGCIHEYLSDNESRIMAYLSGDVESLYDDDTIKKMILNLYKYAGFKGLSLDDFISLLNLPEQISVDRVKKVIGQLIADKKLEYVDYRCYRIYTRFEDYLEACDSIDDRSREVLRRRLMGETLEQIGIALEITRERVRQIAKKESEALRKSYSATTGMLYFDEDYYSHLISTYELDRKDGEKWLGIPSSVWYYLELFGIKRGTKDLNEALMDLEGLEAGMRLKIKNYLNRNKLFVDGVWVEKKRSDLESVVVRKFCQENVSFDDFCEIYNDFLRQEEIPYDDKIYYTEEVKRTRENRLCEADFLLWKLNKQMRYYDIASRDYTELLDVLNLDSYENIEISTVKFMRDYPDIMIKYDIRDQYELHNLLRKIIPEGSYHDFHCGRMPDIEFGKFDRDAAITSLLMDSAPISKTDFADLVSDIYGYDPAVVMGSYFNCINAYYHDGMFTVDHKQMTSDNMIALKNALTDDFYYISEIREIYNKIVPNSDSEEINTYNLKTMGLVVYPRYVLQNYSTLDSYFYDLLTREDVVDITSYRNRFGYVQAFSIKLMELKRNLEIVEFLPNQIINIRKLERSGATREKIQDFCDVVYDAVPDGEYFSIKSLKKGGFESELFDLGFEDWFYANLLHSDNRFTIGNMFGTLIIYKGNADITIKSFLMHLICGYGMVDMIDLQNELNDGYGCNVTQKSDITVKVKETPVYYDGILDKLYANKDLYYNDLERGGF